MAFTTYKTSGDEVPASYIQNLISEVRPVFARKTLDETVNNSAVMQNDDALFVSVAANTTYKFELNLRITTNTTADFKSTFTFPTGLTMQYSAPVITAGASAMFPFSLSQTDTVAIEGNASAFTAVYEGLVVVSSTAGTLQVQWAQNTANLSNTVVSAGSYLLLTKVE